ncbi:hypothetical protein JCM19047_2936 [Bacillus sp. JCM 19047]|nr:hypothetical protein JCM19047_2936 [Bacillus sp. JCM 19047]
MNLHLYRLLDQYSIRVKQRIHFKNLILKGDQLYFPKGKEGKKNRLLLNHFLICLTLLMGVFLFINIISKSSVENKLLLILITIFLIALLFITIIKRVISRIVRLYPDDMNHNFEELMYKIAITDIQLWLLENRISPLHINEILLPYLQEHIAEKEKFSTKTLIYTGLTGAIIAIPVFLTNITVVLSLNILSNEIESILSEVIIITIMSITGIFIISKSVFTVIGPPLPKKTYILIERLLRHTLINKNLKKTRRVRYTRHK